jgi:hypothetical protein
LLLALGVSTRDVLGLEASACRSLVLSSLTFGVPKGVGVWHGSVNSHDLPHAEGEKAVGFGPWQLDRCLDQEAPILRHAELWKWCGVDGRIASRQALLDTSVPTLKVLTAWLLLLPVIRSSLRALRHRRKRGLRGWPRAAA